MGFKCPYCHIDAGRKRENLMIHLSVKHKEERNSLVDIIGARLNRDKVRITKPSPGLDLRTLGHSEMVNKNG